MTIDVSPLESLNRYAMCWYVGSTPLGTHECRIWPRDYPTDPKAKGRTSPVITETGKTFDEAIAKALMRFGARLGDGTASPPPGT